MVTVRSAKNKGRTFERDCEYSLQQKYSDCFMTHEKGYILEYDLKSDEGKFVVECKRLKGISWNQAVNFFDKLFTVAPKDYLCYLFFKSNNQPCLVMQNIEGKYSIQSFEAVFGIPFLKHESTKKVVKVFG